MVSRDLKIRDVQNERCYGAEDFYKDLFFGPIQPGIYEHSEGLTILILEFDTVMVKTLYRRYKNHMLAKKIVLQGSRNVV